MSTWRECRYSAGKTIDLRIIVNQSVNPPKTTGDAGYRSCLWVLFVDYLEIARLLCEAGDWLSRIALASLFPLACAVTSKDRRWLRLKAQLCICAFFLVVVACWV